MLTMTQSPTRASAPSLLEGPPVTSLVPQTLCYLRGGFLDYFNSGAQPQEPEPCECSLRPGLGYTAQDKQNSQSGWSDLSPAGWEEALWLPSLTVGEIGEMPSETGDEGWEVLHQARNEGRGHQSQGAPFKQITCTKKSNRPQHETNIEQKFLSIGWHPEAAKHQRTEKWGWRKSGCEDRVLSTRGAGWGRSGGPGAQASFLPLASHCTGPGGSAQSCLDMQMERVREHFKTSGMKFKIESCQP